MYYVYMACNQLDKKIHVRISFIIIIIHTYLYMMCMYVAPPMRMGAWSMARVLRQWIEYYT